jgi:hypothetical protein
VQPLGLVQQRWQRCCRRWVRNGRCPQSRSVRVCAEHQRLKPVCNAIPHQTRFRPSRRERFRAL